MPPVPGWYAVVWAGDNSNDGSVDRIVLDYTATSSRTIVLNETFEEGWARDRFFVVKDGKRRKPSEIGWRVQGERSGTFGFEGSSYIYDAFFVGPHPPDSDFDRSNVSKAMQEHRASSDQ
ncbi:MAG: hypothetical protein IH983_14945 [Planctomycetes bacterium]|nr:hypothetical protein [Planctomycetota bacterium]